MFAIVEFWKNVCVRPSELGSRFEEYTDITLRKSIEGKNVPPYGYVICVCQIMERQKGRVQDGSANVIIPVKVKALIFEPVRGEVMDGVVTSINAMGFFASCGPVKAFVPKSNFSSDFKLEDNVWHSDNEVISIHTTVRIRLLGFKTDANGITAVGKINQDYLGIVNM